jgi:hypothetical protein
MVHSADSIDDSIAVTQSEIANRAPVLLTTDGDVPVTTDLKRMMIAFNSIASRK